MPSLMHKLKPKTKNNILGLTFMGASLFMGSTRAFVALMIVCIVWSVLYIDIDG